MNGTISFTAKIDTCDNVFGTMFLEHLCETIIFIKELTNPEEAQYSCIYDVITLADYTVYENVYLWTIPVDPRLSLRINIRDDADTQCEGRNINMKISYYHRNIHDEMLTEYECMIQKINGWIHRMCNTLRGEIDKYNAQFGGEYKESYEEYHA